MSFLSKIKNFLGIGGVKVQLELADSFKKEEESITGKVILTSKSDQFMKDLTVKLEEEYSTGSGEEKVNKTFTLGMRKIDVNREIKAGETQEISFDFPFEIIKSNNDEMKEKGGLMGMAGKIGAFANAERSTYRVHADLDVDKVALDPSDMKKIKLT